MNMNMNTNTNMPSTQLASRRNRRTRAAMAATTLCLFSAATSVHSFTPVSSSTSSIQRQTQRQDLVLNIFGNNDQTETEQEEKSPSLSLFSKANHQKITKFLSTLAVTATISSTIFLSPFSAHAENELSAKYGGKGFDSSLVDQTCLVDKCSVQAKACLKDDPSCRKGLTCTAKCMGDNACITGCMARYGDENLDNLLKCTIEDNECIKIAILDGGADKFGEEPRPPAPTVKNFRMNSMEGAWYKVVGFNPNYDCYACQKNTFSAPEQNGLWNRQERDKLELDVKFSMPRMMPDGTPPPPTNEREIVESGDDGKMFGSQSIGFNDYETREMMVFDKSLKKDVVFGQGTNNEQSYARTAHSEGEMFGLKFWENWYIIGENDPGQPDFKFVYYNGKTRQNTYDGAFVYSRSRNLDTESMKKVYKIASDAGMNPDQFCKIRNGCFDKDETSGPDSGMGSSSSPFRGIIASTKISQLLGVEPVAAENVLSSTQTATAKAKLGLGDVQSKRAWWYEVGDYLEDPHRHFRAMDSLRTVMDWPEEVKNAATSTTSRQ